MTAPNPKPSRAPLVSDQLRRGVLWSMVVSLIIGAAFSTILLLLAVEDPFSWRINGSIFCLTLHCAVALYFMRSAYVDSGALSIRIALMIIPINLLIVLVDVWYSSDQWQAWFQTWLLLVGAILLTPARILGQKRLLRAPVIAANIITCIAIALACFIEWNRRFDWIQLSYLQRETLGKAAASAWVLASGVALCLMLFIWRPAPKFRPLRIAIIAATAIAAILIILLILDVDLLAGEFEERLALVFSILATCGMAIHLVLARLFSPTAKSPPVTAIKVSATCPKCLEIITIHTGTSDCPHCSTTFDLRIRPKSCIKCNYDFSGLSASTCPECGTIY